MAKPIPFPLSGGQQVGADYVSPDGKPLEPSGLAVLNSRLYLASDNGCLMSVDLSSRTPLNKQAWRKEHDFSNDSGRKGKLGSYDLECLTVVAGKLMIGVEGGSSAYPHIIRYNTVKNEATGSTWKITDVQLADDGGMEAMTFVPASACPSFGGAAQHGGYFFAAYQSKPGYVYAYDLAKGGKKRHTVNNHLKKFTITDSSGSVIKMQASDMCFADGYLFVLFDGGGKHDELHLFSIASDGNSLAHVSAVSLPVIAGVWEKRTDFEGIAVDGSNLYLSVDQKDGMKLVWCWPDCCVSKFM